MRTRDDPVVRSHPETQRQQRGQPRALRETRFGLRADSALKCLLCLPIQTRRVDGELESTLSDSSQSAGKKGIAAFRGILRIAAVYVK